MQHGKVIQYTSRQLKVHEKNYPIYGIELAIVEFPLKIWSYYLYGVHVDVFTNQKSLQYVFTQKELNLWRRMWLEIFKDYDMSVLYHPGKVDVVVDALSKMSMGSVTYGHNDNKVLVNKVHRFARLGIRLEDSPKEGFIVHRNSESSSRGDV